MILPLSLTGKYQLVILGPERDSQISDCAARLDTALNLSFSNLGVDLKKFLARVTSETAGRPVGTASGPWPWPAAAWGASLRALPGAIALSRR
jgi:hypothetical protein